MAESWSREPHHYRASRNVVIHIHFVQPSHCLLCRAAAAAVVLITAVGAANGITDGRVDE